ncbi:MAG: response regulator [Elusimicrobiales bacterium]|nr:response regulator [Elusimicrobiales bacterium]NLH40147.1 response regulator [Elusimicrobiota bacterium]
MENKLKILIADDDADISELLSNFLASKGHSCDVVNNGKDAILKVRNNEYDLLLLDVIMPYMDGYHVAYEITNNLENPPIIIILTSRDIQFEKPIAKMSGAYDIIQKPFKLDMLISVIENAFKSKDKNKQEE